MARSFWVLHDTQFFAKRAAYMDGVELADRGFQPTKMARLTTSRPTFRTSGSRYLRISRSYSVGLLGYIQKVQDLALEVRQLGMEDLHDLRALEQDATLRVAE